MFMKRKRVIFRVFPFNRFTFPVLLNVWEKAGIDSYFDIVISEGRVACKEGDIVVYSFMTPHLPIIAEEIYSLKDKNVLIAAGGSHIDGSTELPLKIGVNILFKGFGEESFKQFGNDLISGNIKDGGKTYSRKVKTDLNKYLPFSKYFKMVPPLEIFRGCLWNCKYCQTGTADYSFRSMNSIVTFLKGLKEKSFKRVTFISPSALEYGSKIPGKPDHSSISELLETVASFGFNFFEYGIFPSEIRPGTLDKELVKILKKNVTNKWITLGAQSGSDERLKELHRGHSTYDVESDIEIANSYGFKVNLDFIIGYPDESEDEREKTLSFIRKLSKRYRVKIHLHHFFPLSGSEYQFRLPTYLKDEDKKNLHKLNNDGIVTGWWEKHEIAVKNYFGWLKDNYPEYLNNYT